ncbi:MAG: hypothetical protein AAF788_02720 [Pseudomonadota bacterium]
MRSQNASIVSAIIALLMITAGNARASDRAPDWVQEEVARVEPLLTAVLGLKTHPDVILAWQRASVPEGVRIIDAHATDQAVDILLIGAWAEASGVAKRQLIHNLAHEMAHVWQRQWGTPTEDRLLHEGFAEAIAGDILTQCGAACGGNPHLLDLKLRGQCAEALAVGVLATLDGTEAVYGCGGVLTKSMADAGHLSPRDLYQAFARTDRSMQDFLDISETAAGQRFAFSARTFLTRDHRLAQPSDVIARLRAGRL